MKSPAEIKIDAEKAEQWLKNGAQPTETAKSVIKDRAESLNNRRSFS